VEVCKTFPLDLRVQSRGQSHSNGTFIMRPQLLLVAYYQVALLGRDFFSVGRTFFCAEESARRWFLRDRCPPNSQLAVRTDG
jgi:hypothetical protein